MIKLVPIEEGHLGELRDWRNSSWLRPFVREHRLLNMINQRDWLDHISRSDKVEMFGIVRQVGDGIETPGVCGAGFELLGVCGLGNISWTNRTAEVSIYIVPKFQREGVATRTLEALQHKAFEEFNLHRLWAEIFEFNSASIALFQKCGYSVEGRLRKHVFKHGKYQDSLIYGLLREEI